MKRNEWDTLTLLLDELRVAQQFLLYKYHVNPNDLGKESTACIIDETSTELDHFCLVLELIFKHGFKGILFKYVLQIRSAILMFMKLIHLLL